MKKALFSLAEALIVGTALVIIMHHFGIFPVPVSQKPKTPQAAPPVFNPWDTVRLIQLSASQGYELSWMDPKDTFVHNPMLFYPRLYHEAGTASWDTVTRIEFDLFIRKKK